MTTLLTISIEVLREIFSSDANIATKNTDHSSASPIPKTPTLPKKLSANQKSPKVTNFEQKIREAADLVSIDGIIQQQRKSSVEALQQRQLRSKSQEKLFKLDESHPPVAQSSDPSGSRKKSVDLNIKAGNSNHDAVQSKRFPHLFPSVQASSLVEVQMASTLNSTSDHPLAAAISHEERTSPLNTIRMRNESSINDTDNRNSNTDQELDTIALPLQSSESEQGHVISKNEFLYWNSTDSQNLTVLKNDPSLTSSLLSEITENEQRISIQHTT